MKRWRILTFASLLGVFFVILLWTGQVRFQIGEKQLGEKNEAVFSSKSSVASVTWELLISPYGVEKELLDIFAQTTYQVHMRNYLLTEKTFLRMFANLWQMWKEVKIILENEVYGGDTKAFDKARRRLEPYDVQLVSDEKMWTNFVHAKTMIIDDDTFVIATANFTYPSLWRNREYWFVGKNKAILRSLSSIFDKDFNGEKLSKKDIDTHLYVCPIDCREKISNALKNAKKSIQIETQYIQDWSLVKILQHQKSRGIHVQLLVGDKQEPGRLESFGTWFKMLGDPYIHAKNILIDDKLLIMWSANLSENALDNNREIGIFIDDPKIIKKFQGQFERDWNRKRAKS